MIETYSVVFKKNNTKAYDLTFNYTYDNYHQVTEIKYTDNLPFETEEITLAKYTYDVLGQLLTEYDLNSGEYNEYTYDNQGNVLTKTMYDNTAFSFSNGQITHPANYSYKVLSYTYDTSVYNKLTSYTLKQYDHSANSNTEVETTLQTKNLTYDALGNLNDYTAEIDGTSTNYDLCWAGDKLVLAAANNYGYSYQYDDSGRLIKKSKVDTDMIPEMEINYIWKGDLLDGYQINIYESFLTVTIKNLYDENNHLIGLNYHYAVFYGQGDQSQMSTEDFFPNDSIIWFINDGQGNVIGMYNETGEISIGCSYNASGNGQYEVELTDNYMADLEAKYNALYPNDPARALLQLELERARVQTVYKALSNRLFEETGYRSMIYDSDTGLIFCEGRYYSPFYSRFINANPKTVLEHQDMPFSTNLYTYCFNNPVNYKVYQLEDGSFCEITSSSPLHILQDGHWTEAKKIALPQKVEDIEKTCKKLVTATKSINSTEHLRSTVFDDNVTPVFLNALNDEYIDENSIMLLKINNIVSQRSFQLTQSARVFLDLSIEAEDSSFMYAYKNISSMDNVDYSDYNTFDYISNGNNENNLLDKVEITDSNLYSFEITKAYDSWSKGFCPNDGLAFCASSSDNYYAAYYAEMFVLRTYTIIQPSVCENNHVVDMDEAGLVHIDPYVNTLMVQREETPGVSTTLPVDIQHIYEQYKYGRGHSCKI